MDYSHVLATVVMPNIVLKKQFVAIGMLNKECHRAYVLDRDAFVTHRDSQRKAIADKIRRRNPSIRQRGFAAKLHAALEGSDLLTPEITTAYVAKSFAGTRLVSKVLKTIGKFSSVGRDFFVKANKSLNVLYLHRDLVDAGLLTDDAPPEWYAWAFARELEWVLHVLELVHPEILADKKWLNAQLCNTQEGRNLLGYVNADTWAVTIRAWMNAGCVYSSVMCAKRIRFGRV
jgi:hypothetical protein